MKSFIMLFILLSITTTTFAVNINRQITNAINSGKLKLVKELYESQEGKFKNNNFLLLAASNKNDSEGKVLHFLVSKLASEVTNTDSKQNSALHLAAKNSKTQGIKALATMAPTLLDKENSDGALPIHFAAMKDDLDNFLYLAKLRPKSLLSQDDKGLYPVFYSLKSSKTKVLTWHLSKKNKYTQLKDNRGASLFHVAIELENINAAHLLFSENNKFTTYTDNTKQLPLHYATKYRLRKSVRFLYNLSPGDFSQQLNFSKDTSGQTPYSYVITSNNENFLDFILSFKSHR